MTDTDYEMARDSFAGLGFDASQGAGDRLNQALAVKSIASIKGDAEVKTLVGKMLAKAAGGVYFASLNNLLNALSGSTSTPAPQTPAPLTPPPSTQASGNYPIGKHGVPIRPLSIAEQKAVIDGFKSVSYNDIATEVEADFGRGFYPQADARIIQATKEIIGTVSKNSKESGDALWQFLAAIDQRNMTTDARLTLAEMVPVSGTLGSSAPTSTPQSTTTTPSAPIPSDLKSQLEAMGFIFNNRDQIEAIRMVSIGAPEGDYPIWLAASDAGLRLVSGWAMTGKPAPNDTISNPTLWQTFSGTERDGRVFWDLGGSTRRKTFSFFLAGFKKGQGGRKGAIGRFVDFCVEELGRGWRFNTFPAGGSDLGDISTAFQIDADNPNPNVFRVGDQLRRLTIGADGRPDFGEVVDEYQ